MVFQHTAGETSKANMNDLIVYNPVPFFVMDAAAPRRIAILGA